MGCSASSAKAQLPTRHNRFMRSLARLKQKKAYAGIAPPPKATAIAPPPTPTPQRLVPQDWVAEEVALLDAQANKLRRTIARRRASTDSKGAAPIVDHYERVLKDLEHQIASMKE